MMQYVANAIADIDNAVTNVDAALNDSPTPEQSDKLNKARLELLKARAILVSM